MAREIILFARDPGGANTVAPLVQPLRAKGYLVKLFGKDKALEQYKKFGLSGVNIMDSLTKISPELIESFLKKQTPKVIVTGTSADDFTEKYMWKAANKLGIPSVAILDNWMNYGVRFSKYSVSELNKYNLIPSHTFTPSKIFVMDKYAFSEAVKAGLPKNKLVITGQPYFETLNNYRKKTHNQKAIKRMLGLKPGNSVLTYVSEPISKIYKERDNSPHYWGYTERTIFSQLIKALNPIAKIKRDLIVLIKLHPKDDPDNYKDLISKIYYKTILFKGNDIDQWDVIMASDSVWGMSSMLLIESIILSKPTFSVQIGLSRENPFVLSKAGLFKTILTNAELETTIRETLLGNKKPIYKFKVVEKPIENVVNEIGKYV